MGMVQRVANLGRREVVAREIDEELQAHVEMRIEENLAQGMTEREARRDALVRFGNRAVTRERVVGEDVALMVESIWADVRYGVRQLMKNPGFAVTAVLVLALGIGASVALFAFVDAALIKPLPYAEPNRLLDVTEMAPFGRANLSYQDYLDWKRMQQSLSSLSIYGGTGFLLGGADGSSAEPVPGLKVSADFFGTLGVKPALGRDFYATEDQPQAAATVILSHGAWLQRFGGRRDVIGQTINLSGVPTTVVGVLPESFQFAPRGNGEFFTPEQVKPDMECEMRRSCHNLVGVGRLKDGVTVEQARSEFERIAANLERQYPDSNRQQGASVVPLTTVFTGDVKGILLALLAGAGLLLVIACVNVSSLLLVRSENRRREFALRGALGASRARLLRQFVTEGVLLVVASGLLGVLTAFFVMRTLLGLIPVDMLRGMPYLQGIGLNGHVLAFATMICVVAATLFSLTPLVRLRIGGGGLASGMSDGSKGSSGTLWRRFGANLVALELAIAMVLLVSAGLLGKSFYKLLHVNLGFVPEHVATLNLTLPPKTYVKEDQQRAAAREILSRVGRLPGVTGVGSTSLMVVTGNGNTDWIRFVGRPWDGTHIEVNEREVSPGYLPALEATLLSGRQIGDADDGEKPRVAIVNEAFAKRYFPGANALGARFGDTDLKPSSLKEIVGVVADVHEAGLDTETWPTVYYPYAQTPDSSMSLAVRTSGDEAQLLPTLVTTIHGFDPGIGMSEEETLPAVVSGSQAAYLHRSAAWLVGGFAVLALVLSVIGLYGVIAYSVSQRTREIGVRMALGAERASVSRLILGEAARLIGFGVAAGVVCSIGAAVLGKKLLFGTAAWDVSTLVTVAVVLGGSALMASWLPARRAASVNPMEALRAE